MSAPAAEPLTCGQAREEESSGLEAGQELLGRASSLNQTSPSSPATATATATARVLEHKAQSQALHSTAEHVLIHCSLCAIPPGPAPSVIPSTRPVSDHHRPPTKSLETRVLLALRGGNGTCDTRSRLWDRTSLASERCWTVSAALRGLLGELSETIRERKKIAERKPFLLRQGRPQCD